MNLQYWLAPICDWDKINERRCESSVAGPDDAVIDSIEHVGMSEAGVGTELEAGSEGLFEKHPQND